MREWEVRGGCWFKPKSLKEKKRKRKEKKLKEVDAE
jgi:hypothetical protein